MSKSSTTRLSLVLFATALCTTAQAAGPINLAQGESLAHLQQPVDPPITKIIDGRVWACARDTCYVAHQDAADSEPLRLECSNAARELGRFVDYQTGPDILNPGQLATCNAKAKIPQR